MALRHGGFAVLSMEDLIAFTGLSEAEILAIAEHEHIPEAAACCLAEYLAKSQEGEIAIRNMIIDDIRAAQKRRDREHGVELLHVLHHFLRSHPGAVPKSHPWSSQI
jgi:hypothetical protein